MSTDKPGVLVLLGRWTGKGEQDDRQDNANTKRAGPHPESRTAGILHFERIATDIRVGAEVLRRDSPPGLPPDMRFRVLGADRD